VSGRLPGRAGDLQALAELRQWAGAGQPAAVHIVGDAGIGKTTLLAAAAAEAAGDGWETVGFQGARVETRISYGGLLGIVGPLQGHISDIPEEQGRALTAVLHGGGPVAGGRFLLGAATISLLSQSSTSAPLVVAVDDTQWVDPESLTALAFAARRLTTDPVVFLFAGRPDTGDTGPLTGLPVHRLDGLDPVAAAEVVGPAVAPAVLAELVDRSGGNPLALVECGRALTAAQRSGAAPLPRMLPVGVRLFDAFAEQVGRLPDDARTALLFLAAADAPVAAAREALGSIGVDLDCALADAADLVRWDADRPRWRHPLIQAAVWRSASPDRRRWAMGRLADALPPGPARSWARAGAAAGFDDSAALGLAELAGTQRTRGGFAAAAAAGERAAQLTRDPVRAARLLAQAAHDAGLAGDTAGVQRMAGEVLAGAADDGARAQSLAALGNAAQFHGSHQRARDLLLQAAELATGSLLLNALVDAAHLSYIIGDEAAIHRCARRAEQAADPGDPPQRMLGAYLSGVSAALTGDFSRAAGQMRAVLDLLEGPEVSGDPQYLLVTVLVGRWSLDPALAQPHVEQQLARARARGALGALAPALSLIAAGYAMFGDNRRAYALAGEAVELLDILGFTTEPGIAHEMLAVQCAARGAADQARTLLERAVAAAAAAGLDPDAPHLTRARAFCELCAGHLDAVVATLEDLIARHGGPGPFMEPLGVTPDLVDAYLGLGRADDAADLVRRFMDANPHPAPYLAAIMARCRGQVAADPGEATAAFAEAVRLHAAAPLAVDVGRTHLAYGMRLRRDGQRVAARRQLEAARSLFQRDELAAWVGRCDAELRATGASRNVRGTGAPLTAQETQVALMVAQGLSNRDIAAALFLSPRTVEHHVGAALRKKGFSSRTQLAAAMLAADRGEAVHAAPRS
jgi:DNA-binding CsgD family transcriptional regulator